MLDDASSAVYVGEVAPPKTKQPKRSTLATQIVERWGEAGGDMLLDRLMSELGEVQRYDIVAALKELERAGAGEFTVGRSGRKARFVWSNASRARPVAARKPARPAANSNANSNVKRPEPAAKRKRHSTPEAPREAASVLEHAFHLRPGHVVKVRLPSDVASLEVERLCQFLRALPFNQSRES